VSCAGTGPEEKGNSLERSNADQGGISSDIEMEESPLGQDPLQEISDRPEDDNAPRETKTWQELALVDARSGETFTLSDFDGKQVFVEPMATWCSNCRRQLTNVQAAREQLADGAVFIALSVETNIDDATLAGYADDAGFDWLFAVATPEILEGLTAEFGRSIVNPPATPHFIIRADGSVTELFTGIDPAAEIVSRITAAQG
jgi:thiol-disulfide isomerase/thioredoxin